MSQIFGIMTEQEIRNITRDDMDKSFRPKLDIITLKSAALSLGLSRMSIYRMIKDGRLSLVKIGSRSYLRVKEIHALYNE